MDWQSAFNVAAAFAGALGGWFLRIMWDAQGKLRDDMSALAQKLSDDYVRRDDLRDILSQLRLQLDRIETKLDGKADK